MTVAASISIRTTIAGVTIAQSITRNEEVESHLQVTVPAGKAGTLSTRTDDNTGVGTVAADHGITTSDTVTVFWSGGSRRGMTVTATTSTTISVDGGAGDNLPTALTAITIGKEVSHSVDIDGDKLVALAVKSTQRTVIDFLTSAPASIQSFDMEANEGRHYIDALDMTNFLAGEIIATVKSANGSATAATLDIGLLLNAD